MNLRSLLAPALLLSGAFVPTQADVLILDDDGGPDVDFTSLEEALTQAQDGDTLLIRTGNYSGPALTINLTGRSLVIVGDGGEQLVGRSLNFTGLATGDSLVLRNLKIGEVYAMLSFQDCHGATILDACTLGGPPLFVRNSSGFIVTQCTVSSSILSGLYLENSSATVYDTWVEPGVQSFGPHGAWIRDSKVRFSGGGYLGGDEGELYACWTYPRPGGDGLHVTGPGSDVEVMATHFEGGLGTPALDFCGFRPGPEGVPINWPEGTVREFPGAARRLSFGPATRVGQALRVTLEGAPGELAFVATAAPLRRPLASAFSQGWLALQPPWRILAVTTMDAGGTRSLDFPIGSIGGEERITLFGQALFLTQAGPVLSSPSMAVILEPAL